MLFQNLSSTVKIFREIPLQKPIHAIIPNSTKFLFFYRISPIFYSICVRVGRNSTFVQNFNKYLDYLSKFSSLFDDLSKTYNLKKKRSLSKTCGRTCAMQIKEIN